jgi:hypothetical protein
VKIAKLAKNSAAFYGTQIPFPNARIALKAVIESFCDRAGDLILLPSYIGWSKNEGSGVFDPVRETGIGYHFYRLSRTLEIDFADICKKIESLKPRIVLLIHFFGYPDVFYREISEFAHNHGCLVLEDEAHSLFSHFVGGATGRYGDASIFSLHKMLPVPCGGLLRISADSALRPITSLIHSRLRHELPFALFDFDFYGIFEARRSTAMKMLQCIQESGSLVHPLRPILPPGVAPQTLPITVRCALRDRLYFDLNDLGFGVVSLYHTLVSFIPRADFADSFWLSERILNLPTHQDVNIDFIGSMFESLRQMALEDGD